MRAPLLLVSIVIACGGGGAREPSAPAPTPPPDAGVGAPLDRAALAEVASGLEEVLATMAAIVEGAADCPTMARQLGELFDRSEPLFAIARTQGADPTAGPVLTAELDARAAAVGPLVERISTGLVRCREDAGVVEAVRRMPTL